MRRAAAAFALLLSWRGVAMAADAPAGAVPEKAPDAARTSAEVLLLRAAIVAPSDVSPGSKNTGHEPQTLARARQLDLTLSDAAQDLGFTLDLSERASQDEHALGDLEVITRAAKGTRDAGEISAGVRRIVRSAHCCWDLVRPSSRSLYFVCSFF